MISLNDLEPNKHYWMFNKNYEGGDIWRTIYTIEDHVYPYGPIELYILFNGDSRRFPKEYFKDDVWREVGFVQLEPPKGA